MRYDTKVFRTLINQIRRNVIGFTLALIVFDVGLYLLNSHALKGLEIRSSTLAGTSLQLKLLILFACLLTYLALLKLILNESRLSKFLDTLSLRQISWVSLLAPLTAGFAYFHIEFVAPILYETLRISYIRPVFADLRTVLIAIDCEDVTSMGSLITCDYRGGNNAFIYPSILLKLRTLGISEFFTFGIFITCLILFLLAIKFIYESQNIKKPAFFLSFLTPPFFLVFDRLNLDIVIVTILIFSVYFFNKNLFTLPVALISLTALLKFYTLPLLFICFLLAKTKRRLITCLISVIGVLILLGEDLFKAPGSVGADINGSYGLPVLLSHYSGLSFASLNQNFWVYLHFLMIFGLAYLILHVSFAKQLIVDLRRSRTITLFTLFFTLIHFSTWLTSSNYPYRFVFLLFFSSQILIFSIREEIKIFLFFTILYTTFLSPATMGYLQNLLLVPISAFCLLLIIQSLKIVCSRNGLGDVGHVVRSQ